MARGFFNQQTMGIIASQAFKMEIPQEQHPDLPAVYQAAARAAIMYRDQPIMVDLVYDNLDWIEEIYNARMMG